MFAENSPLRNFFKAGKVNPQKPSFIHSVVTKQHFRKTVQEAEQPQFLNFGSTINSKGTDQGFIKKADRAVSNSGDAFSLLNLGEKSSINRQNVKFEAKNEPIYTITNEQYHSNMISNQPSRMIPVEAIRPSSIIVGSGQYRNQNQQPLGNSKNHQSLQSQNESNLHKIMAPSKASTNFQSKVSTDAKIENVGSFNRKNKQKQPTIVFHKPREDQIQSEQKYNVLNNFVIPRKIVQAEIYLRCPDQIEYKKMVDQVKAYKQKKIEQSKKQSNIVKFR